MSVHPHYAKRFNQARDIRRIVVRLNTRPLTGPDESRLYAIADDLKKSADLVRHGGYLVAILYWPEDEDRGEEVYGPFTDEAARADWVNEVCAAADAGDALLKGVHLRLLTMPLPFPVQR